MGDDVRVAKEGERDPLALARLQHTIQRQDIENLEVGEERSGCRAWKLMQKSSHGLEQSTDMAGGASSSNTGKIILISSCIHSTYHGGIMGKIFSRTH